MDRGAVEHRGNEMLDRCGIRILIELVRIVLLIGVDAASSGDRK
jgi:hypothetical protein